MDAIDDPVMCGVVRNGPDPENITSVALSERFVLGPEAAHVNISGASGLATKTSAAVFLMQSLLSRASNEKRKVAAVAFNLKSEDLLFLERNSGDEETILGMVPPEQRLLYNCVRNQGVELTFNPDKLRYFAPARAYDVRQPDSLRQDGKVEVFYWTYGNVLDRESSIRLTDLVDPEDLDERTFGVLAKVEELSSKQELQTFSDVIEFLENELAGAGREWHGHHVATVSKALRILKITTQFRLRGLFSYDVPEGRDIPIEGALEPGSMWVLDIQALNDKGKRIVFYNVIDRIARILEHEKVKNPDERHLDSVVVFVDELNKFAPSGGPASAPLKQRIIDIAARGRSIGLVMLGAQQFASGVDSEVYGNTSTQLVGRSEISELRDSTYGWISKDLQYLVASLPKGRLLLRHSLYTRPIVIHFPKPLYTYTERDIQRSRAESESRLLEEKRRAEAKVRDKYKTLAALANGLKQTAETIYEDCVPLRQLGVGRQTYQAWFDHWRGQLGVAKGSESEQKALEITLRHLESKSHQSS
jgi:hypothetical protein